MWHPIKQKDLEADRSSRNPEARRRRPDREFEIQMWGRRDLAPVPALTETQTTAPIRLRQLRVLERRPPPASSLQLSMLNFSSYFGAPTVADQTTRLEVHVRARDFDVADIRTAALLVVRRCKGGTPAAACSEAAAAVDTDRTAVLLVGSHSHRVLPPAAGEDNNIPVVDIQGS